MQIEKDQEFCIKRQKEFDKILARKEIYEISNHLTYDKKQYSLKEYLNIKRKSDKKIEQLLIDASLDTESAGSLNTFLEYKESKDKIENMENEKNNNKIGGEIEGVKSNEEALPHTINIVNIIVQGKKMDGSVNIEEYNNQEILTSKIEENKKKELFLELMNNLNKIEKPKNQEVKKEKEKKEENNNDEGKKEDVENDKAKKDENSMRKQ